MDCNVFSSIELAAWQHCSTPSHIYPAQNCVTVYEIGLHGFIIDKPMQSHTTSTSFLTGVYHGHCALKCIDSLQRKSETHNNPI